MTILLFAEHDNISLSEQTARALTAAARIGGDIDIVVAGKDAEAVAQEAARLDGVRRVLLAECDALEHRLAEPTAALLVSLGAEYDVVIAPATTTGKNVLPRVAGPAQPASMASSSTEAASSSSGKAAEVVDLCDSD